MEDRNGFIVDLGADSVTGTVERDAAIVMLAGNFADTARITLGADKACDTRDFVEACRALSVTPHVAQNMQPGRRRTAIDARTTRHLGYAMSIITGREIEPLFGWMKRPGRMKRTRYRGTREVGWFATLVRTASISSSSTRTLEPCR